MWLITIPCYISVSKKVFINIMVIISITELSILLKKCVLKRITLMNIPFAKGDG